MVVASNAELGTWIGFGLVAMVAAAAAIDYVRKRRRVGE